MRNIYSKDANTCHSEYYKSLWLAGYAKTVIPSDPSASLRAGARNLYDGHRDSSAWAKCMPTPRNDISGEFCKTVIPSEARNLYRGHRDSSAWAKCMPTPRNDISGESCFGANV
jgi:hypothetical protein